MKKRIGKERLNNVLKIKSRDPGAQGLETINTCTPHETKKQGDGRGQTGKTLRERKKLWYLQLGKDI